MFILKKKQPQNKQNFRHTRENSTEVQWKLDAIWGCSVECMATNQQAFPFQWCSRLMGGYQFVPQIVRQIVGLQESSHCLMHVGNAWLLYWLAIHLLGSLLLWQARLAWWYVLSGRFRSSWKLLWLRGMHISKADLSMNSSKFCGSSGRRQRWLLPPLASTCSPGCNKSCHQCYQAASYLSFSYSHAKKMDTQAMLS